jgi:hypothetical protein
MAHDHSARNRNSRIWENRTMKRKFDRLAKMRLPGLMPWRLPPYGGIDAVMEIPDICHEPMNAVAKPRPRKSIIVARHIDGNEIERILKSTSVGSTGRRSTSPGPAKIIASGSIAPDVGGDGPSSRTGFSGSAAGGKSNAGKRQPRRFEP